MIKAVIFDCFGVLTHGGWKDFWTALPSEELRSKAKDLHRSYDVGSLNRTDFTDQLSGLTHTPLAEVQAIFYAVNPVKNVQLLHYIKSLKPNYKIGLLSNVGTSWIEDQLLSSDELALFDNMIFSYRVAMAKPDPRIYLLAARGLEVEPNECVFIDDIAEYCDAARGVGMKAIVYDSFFDFRDNLSRILSAN
jgi:putative hydrolase of the HAD superfamily